MSVIRIATRGSELALWQAHHVRDALQAARPGLEVELVVIKTRGDIILDRPLSKVGGKALFVKEIEQALLDREAQVAVHSMKDVPAELAPGLAMAATSAREDPRDALCTRDGTGLDALPQGARVGTSSLRRQCQLLAIRPDLEIIPLRGNVPTRLRKLDEGEYDAVVLAAAGLVRLGHGDRISQHLPFELSLPAVGQGVLGIETRADDADTSALVRGALDDAGVARRVAAERAFLLRLGGSCQTPVAAHAVIEGDDLRIEALVGQPDGRVILRASARAPLTGNASALGVTVAEELLGQGAQAILDACESV
ncbi:MAG TPA: hydroxymethylbilane synthase [Kofleriaceae bacterium]|nr:hydroxymethylbilane synthase [Kofleriaceae bacterium]